MDIQIRYCQKDSRWRSGRASDSESRGPGFEPHKRHRVVSLSKAHLLPTVLVKPRKRWLRPDMTEKLLTGTLSLNTNKQTKRFIMFSRKFVKWYLHINQFCTMVQAFIYSLFLFYDFSDIFNLFILNKHEYASLFNCMIRQ